MAPPISMTSPPAVRKSGVQPGSVEGATRISPGASLFQFFPNGPPQVTHARHQQDDGELWHLAQANEIARSSQEEVHEPTPQPALAPCPPDQFCEHAFGLLCSPLELHRRS